MRILLVPDKFKDSLTAAEVIRSITSGIKNNLPSAVIHSYRLADGGDGFLDALKANDPDLDLQSFDTVNAVGDPIKSKVGMDHNTMTAYIELAHSSGIAQLPINDRNALYTSSYGTGLLIKTVLKRGFETVYLGLGGSATNDAGCGIATAMGYSFIDKNNKSFIPTAASLITINDINKNDNREKSIRFFAVNDVKNPLLGERGATYVYGPQKGLHYSDLERVEKGMVNLEKLVKSRFNKDFAALPGAGAAGGIGYGLKVFFDADYIEGIDFFVNKSGIDHSVLKTYDLIITAEGKLDDQTIEGKLIKGISDLGRKENVPVVAFCGKNGLSKYSHEDLGLMDIIEIAKSGESLQYNLENAAELLKIKSEEFISSWMKEN